MDKEAASVKGWKSWRFEYSSRRVGDEEQQDMQPPPCTCKQEKLCEGCSITVIDVDELDNHNDQPQGVEGNEMAARKRKVLLTETWKERIRTSMLLNRLNDHVLGEVEMSSTQVDAAKYLLNKVISNAPTQSEISGPSGGDIPLGINVTFR